MNTREQKTVIREQHANDSRSCSLFSVHYSRSGEAGFTLLLASLVAAIVLSIGAAIFAIATKQVTLSAIGRDSQFAFYTADTAAECALFWDYRTDIASHKGVGFATSSHSDSYLTQVTCDLQTVTFTPVATPGGAQSFFFYAPNDGTTGRCAQVTVTKFQNATGGISTNIHADGYSTKVTPAQASTVCDPSNPGYAVGADATALQRSVELHY